MRKTRTLIFCAGNCLLQSIAEFLFFLKGHGLHTSSHQCGNYGLGAAAVDILSVWFAILGSEIQGCITLGTPARYVQKLYEQPEKLNSSWGGLEPERITTSCLCYAHDDNMCKRSSEPSESALTGFGF